MSVGLKAPFLKRLTVVPEKVTMSEFPFDRLRFLSRGTLSLEFDSTVTIFVGENGAGKSTLLEAIAAAAGFPAYGGSRDHLTGNDHEESALAQAMRLSWLPKVGRGFFFRAESFSSTAAYLDEFGAPHLSGGRKLRFQSHGESFLSLFEHRLKADARAIYLMDEPEAALSPKRQLTFLNILWRWMKTGNVQTIIATHSPILMGLPGAQLLSLDDEEIRRVKLEDTEHYRVTAGFLSNPSDYFKTSG